MLPLILPERRLNAGRGTEHRDVLKVRAVASADSTYAPDESRSLFVSSCSYCFRWSRSILCSSGRQRSSGPSVAASVAPEEKLTSSLIALRVRAKPSLGGRFPQPPHPRPELWTFCRGFARDRWAQPQANQDKTSARPGRDVQTCSELTGDACRRLR